MKDKLMTLAEVKKTIREMDPKVEKSNPDWFRAAIVLLSAAFVGTGKKALQDFCAKELPPETINLIHGRAKRNGIFKKGKVDCEWMDEKNGGIAFWCDVAVVTGMLKRA